VTRHVFHQVGCVEKAGVKIISRGMQVRRFIRWPVITGPYDLVLSIECRRDAHLSARPRVLGPPFAMSCVSPAFVGARTSRARNHARTHAMHARTHQFQRYNIRARARAGLADSRNRCVARACVRA
jgi:hypothetical protein